jgi:hypothetical protein
MSQVGDKKKRKISRSQHTEHSDNCSCQSVTGITEEDMQERE